MSNNIKNVGRLVYIEPNDLSSLNYSFQKGITPDNITFNNEDLNIFVDIQVALPNRNECGQTDYLKEGIQHLVGLNNNYNCFSYLGGLDIKDNKKMLTTSYLDASYTEIVNGNPGSKEALGINSMEIEYNNNFYPVVKMKFTDIRGYGLMMSAEYEYDKQMHNEKVFRNFYSALFHYPYPPFFVTIKGFYGTPITLILAPASVNTSLDSSTGNFNVDVTFNGYSYGLYGDLPMSYLLVAPYMDKHKGVSYWNDAVTDGRFIFSDNSPIPTYLSFLENFAHLGKQTDTGSADFGLANQKNYTKITALNDVYTQYKDLIDNIKTTGSIPKIEDSTNNNYTIYFSTEKIVIEKEKYNNVKSAIEEYNKQNDSYKLPTLEESFTIIDKEGEKTVVISEEQDVVIYNSKQEIHKDFSSYLASNKIDDSVKETLKSKSQVYSKTKYCFILDNEKWIKKADAIIQDLNIVDEKTDGDNENQEGKEASTSLGWIPSIENVYRMLFAHLDCFMTQFFSMLDTISGQINNGQRNLVNYNIDRTMTDIPSGNNGTGKLVIPPFPALFKYENGAKVLMYPTENENFSDMEEVKFVEALISATKNVLQRGVDGENGNTVEESDNNYTVTFAPILPTDIKYQSTNPYSLSDITSGNKYSVMLYTFVVRMIAAKAFYNNEEYLENCIKLEANNFYRYYSDINDDFKEGLKGGKNNANWFKQNLEELIVNNGVQNPQLFETLDNTTNAIGFKWTTENNPVLYFYSLKKEYNNGCLFLSNNTNNEISCTSGETGLEVKVIDKQTNNEIVKSLYTSSFIEFPYPKRIESFKKSFDKSYTEIENWDKVLSFNDTMNEANHYTCPIKQRGRIEDYDGEETGHTMPDEIGNLEDYTKKVQEIKDSIASDNQFKKYQFPFVGVIDNSNFSVNLFDKEKAVIGTSQLLSSDDYCKALLFLGALPISTENIDEVIDIISKNGFNKVRRITLLYIGGLIYRYYWNIANDNKKEFVSILAEQDKLLYGDNNHCYSIRITDGFIHLNKYSNYKPESFKNQSKLDSFANTVQGVGLMNIFKNWASGNGKQIIELLSSENMYDDVDGVKYLKHQCEAEKKLVELCLFDTYILVLNGEIKDISFEYSYLSKFVNELSNLYEEKKELTEVSKVNNNNEITDNDDITLEEKLSIYATLKTLYDKWLSSYKVDRFKLKSPIQDKHERYLRYNSGELLDKQHHKINKACLVNTSEYGNFIFIDTYFNDIGDRFMANPRKLYDVIDDVRKGKNRTVTFECMSNIANSNRLMLQSMPVYTNIYDINSIAEVFKPHQYYECNNMNVGTTYVCIYTYQPSKSISANKKQSEYIDDGLDLADTFGNNAPVDVQKIFGATENTADTKLINYNVPAFGVSYAKQSQSYFTSININSNNSQVTDFSIAKQLEVAETEKHGGLAITAGQDIYSLYSNRSFQCSVTMLGCMNIMPMMYFQLNNIPMFKGAYMVTSVKHSISPGKMITTFGGTRVSKTSLPVNVDNFKVLAASKAKATITSGSTVNGSGSGGVNEIIIGNYESKYFQKGDTDNYNLILIRYQKCGSESIGGVLYEYDTNSILCYIIQRPGYEKSDGLYEVDAECSSGWASEDEYHLGQSYYTTTLISGEHGFGTNMGEDKTMLGLSHTGCLFHYGKSGIGKGKKPWSTGCLLPGEKMNNDGYRDNFVKDEYLKDNIVNSTNINIQYHRNFYQHVIAAIKNNKKVQLEFTTDYSYTVQTQGGVSVTNKSGNLVSITEEFTKAGYKKGTDFVILATYATTSNFTGAVVSGYKAGQDDLWCRESLMKGVIKAMKYMKTKYPQYRFAIYDAYRPAIAAKQFSDWAEKTNKSLLGHYIAKYSENGTRSYHNTGNAIDLTLQDKNGNFVKMNNAGEGNGGGGFDIFKSVSNYNKNIENQKTLHEIMVNGGGLEGIDSEWWHFQNAKEGYLDVTYN